MFIKVGGPTGSGKTTITSELESLGRQMGLPIQRTKGGDILLKLANVESYEELRRIPEEEREKLRPEMYRILYEEDRRDPGTVRVRDAHFTLYDTTAGTFTEAGAQPGDKEQMLMLVVLNPSKELLLERRKRQGMERSDRNFDPVIVDLEIQKELEIAHKEARDLGLNLVVLPNPDGLVKETTLEIIQKINMTRINKEGAGYRSVEF